MSDKEKASLARILVNNFGKDAIEYLNLCHKHRRAIDNAYRNGKARVRIKWLNESERLLRRIDKFLKRHGNNMLWTTN